MTNLTVFSVPKNGNKRMYWVILKRSISQTTKQGSLCPCDRKGIIACFAIEVPWVAGKRELGTNWRFFLLVSAPSTNQKGLGLIKINRKKSHKMP